MSEHKDYDIIDEKASRKKERHTSIYEGVYIKGEIVDFEEVKLFEDKMSVWLPKTFVTMPGAMAKIKYPNENRPQIIKTDLSSTINFNFNLFDMMIKPNEIEDACKGFKSTIKAIQPSTVFYENGSSKLNDTNISWFDFKSPALDGELYNIVYITSIENKVMHGIFNCLYEDMKEWSEVAKQVMMSINDLTTGGE